jgi:predicted aspartyl protease
MRIRTIMCPALAALVCQLATAAIAADCGQLRLLNTVQMVPTSSGLDIVPLQVNGSDQQFLFDTGGNTTMITREAAEKLHLRIQPTYMGMVNVAGGETMDRAFIDDLQVGRLHGKDLKFPIAPFKNIDGVLSLNFMLPYDIDVDFGTDKLNFFSQDHCPGGVLYWKAGAVTAVPFAMEDGHIVIPVTLDGQSARAIIDTGASGTILRMDVARERYKLIPGDEATPEIEKKPDADSTEPRRYSHRFKALAFGDIAVNNLPIGIMEDVWKRDAGSNQLVGDRTRTEKDRVALLPEMIVGMNVMRKLHIYFAFAERKMYISAASTGPEQSDKN